MNPVQPDHSQSLQLILITVWQQGSKNKKGNKRRGIGRGISNQDAENSNKLFVFSHLLPSKRAEKQHRQTSAWPLTTLWAVTAFLQFPLDLFHSSLAWYAPFFKNKINDILNKLKLNRTCNKLISIENNYHLNIKEELRLGIMKSILLSHFYIIFLRFFLACYTFFSSWLSCYFALWPTILFFLS